MINSPSLPRAFGIKLFHRASRFSLLPLTVHSKSLENGFFDFLFGSSCGKYFSIFSIGILIRAFGLAFLHSLWCQ